MAMIVRNHKQGSDQWLKHRMTRHNASDAPAMMAVSPYMKRSELVRMLATGIKPDTTEYQQGIYDSGHRFERYARPLAESIMGCELYPVSGDDPDSLRSASFDGIDEDEAEAWEHKSLNATLREIMVGDFTGRDLPIWNRVQMEQQLAVSGAKRVLFMASAWLEKPDAPPQLIEERHVWYYPDLELRARIEAGWSVLEADVCAYVPEPTKELVVRKAAVVMPDIEISVQGEIAVSSDFDTFKRRFNAYLEGIPKSPSTDQEFADCALAVTDLEKIEKKLKGVAENTLGKVMSVKEVVDLCNTLAEQARKVRLDTDKLVAKRKLEVKGEIATEARDQFAAYIDGLNARIGEPLMPLNLGPDCDAAMKSKRSFDSARESVQNALVKAKLDASEIADRIQLNLGVLKAQDEKHAHLFVADRAAIVLKAADDFAALVKLRVHDFEQREAERIAAETKRIQEAAQANAAKAVTDGHAALACRIATTPAPQLACDIAGLEAFIFTEEVYGPHVASLEAARAGIVEKCRAALEAKRAADAAPPAAAPAPVIETQHAAAPATPAPAAINSVAQRPDGTAAFFSGFGVQKRAEPVNEATFAAPSVSTSKVRLGALCDLMGLSLTAADMSKLGIEPAGKDGASKLYAVADWGRLRAALIGRLEAITEADLEAIATAEKKRA